MRELSIISDKHELFLEGALYSIDSDKIKEYVRVPWKHSEYVVMSVDYDFYCIPFEFFRGQIEAIEGSLVFDIYNKNVKKPDKEIMMGLGVWFSQNIRTFIDDDICRRDQIVVISLIAGIAQDTQAFAKEWLQELKEIGFNTGHVIVRRNDRGGVAFFDNMTGKGISNLAKVVDQISE